MKYRLPHIAVQRQIENGFAAGQWINLETFKDPTQAEGRFQMERKGPHRTRIVYRTQLNGFTCR